MALEQPGPWGAKAFTASHLDPTLGAALEAAAGAAGVRPCLIRPPGRHADTLDGSGPRRVLVASCVPGRVWLLDGRVDDPARLGDLDWAAAAAGDLDGVRRSLPELTASVSTHLLVCTNGTRDVCCALVGRPVAAEAAALLPGRVWEVTHTSGHRFAPTAVLLPHGTLHGRLDAAAARTLLVEADAGRTVLSGHRGSSAWAAAGQVAELAVREATGELALGVLTVEGAATSWTVRHRDGRAWSVEVTSEATAHYRPESCAKAPVPVLRWVVGALVTA